MTSRILVVDDDTALAEMIGIVLRTEGFETAFCADGSKAVDAWRAERPDLILLDLMLPGMDGIEICTRVRAESGIPIIMLTAPHRHGRRREGPRVRRRRLHRQAVQPEGARRPHPHAAAPGRPARRRGAARSATSPSTSPRTRCAAATSAIALTPLEFELLVALASKPQQVFSREMLLEQVWGYHYKADTRLVNVHVQRLRAKVELDPDNPKIVTTVRGVGYRAGAVV